MEGTYRIAIEGILDESWSDCFGDTLITTTDTATVLTGAVVDQAALRGILCRLWDMNVVLVSVEWAAGRPPSEASDVQERNT